MISAILLAELCKKAFNYSGFYVTAARVPNSPCSDNGFHILFCQWFLHSCSLHPSSFLYDPHLRGYRDIFRYVAYICIKSRIFRHKSRPGERGITFQIILASCGCGPRKCAFHRVRAKSCFPAIILS